MRFSYLWLIFYQLPFSQVFSRTKPSFLLPVDVVKNVDIKKPVYIEEMQGFWIIEEIEEYENDKEKVRVSLIRLPNLAEFNDDFNPDFNI